MLEEFQKIIDVESITTFVKENIEEPLGENIDFTSVINHVGGLKIFDFLIAIFKPEYNLQGAWYEQEVNQIKKKFERCVTIEQKKRYLETKLEEHEILFQEHEYFEMVDDLKDSTFTELFNKFSQVRHGFTKTSRWLNASEDDKALLAIADIIPSKLPTVEELSVFKSQQYIRHTILSSPLKYRLFQKLMSFKKGETPPSQLIMDIVSDVFSMLYASKVNVYLREEYQKLIPEKDYVINIVDEESNHPKRKQFTTNRQCLALHYLFKAAGVKNVDNTAKANFAQFLLCKELNALQISNTNIYKSMNQPLKENNNTNIENLKFVKKFFQSVDLQNVAQEIQNEIETFG